MTQLDMDDLIPKYPSIGWIAERAGTDVKWVNRMGHRSHIAEPTLTKGERAFSRIDALKLLVLAQLQRALGAHSEIPFTLVRAADAEIASLLERPDAGTILALQTGGPLRVVVAVPALRELVAGALVAA